MASTVIVFVIVTRLFEFAVPSKAVETMVGEKSLAHVKSTTPPPLTSLAMNAKVILSGSAISRAAKSAAERLIVFAEPSRSGNAAPVVATRPTRKICVKLTRARHWAIAN